VLDDSDANWWRGSNQRGEGLFPSSFVISLDKENSEGITSQVISQPSESRQENVITAVENEVAPLPPPRIDEVLLDQCMEMLGEADPTAVDDSAMPELPGREAQCHAMAPLIDAELERIDREHYELMDLNKRLMEAMQMYNTLMTTSSISAAPMGQLGGGNITGAPQGMWPVGNSATAQSYEAAMAMSQQQMGVGVQSGMVAAYGAPYYGGPLSQGAVGMATGETVQTTAGYTNSPYNIASQYSNNPMSGSYQPNSQLQFQTQQQQQQQQQQHEWMMSQAQSQGQYQNITARRGMAGVGYDAAGQYVPYGSPVNTSGPSMQGGFYQAQPGIVTSSQSGWTPPNPQAY
jgi:hypothetical protein